MSEETYTAPRTLPRLGIRHVMLWTLFTAGYLALFHRLGDTSAISVGWRIWIGAQLVFDAVLAGASLTAFVLLAYVRVRSSAQLRTEPGHWLLIANAATLLLSKPMDFAVVSTFDRDVKIGVELFHWSWAYIGLVQMVRLTVFLLAARAGGTRCWRWTFGALAVFAVVECAYDFAMFSRGRIGIGIVNALYECVSYGNAVMAFAIAAVAVLDILHRERRDWLHWTGVVTSSGRGILDVIRSAVFWLAVWS